MMMSVFDYVLGGLGLLVLAVASPFIYEQATGEPPRTDAAYWAERGYAPLEVVFPARGTDEVAGGR